MSKKIVIEGNIENVLFKNIENGYTVFSINSEEYPHIFPDSEIICVGFAPDLIPGENIKVTGNVIVHPSYGKQLQIESYEKSLPKTEKSIEKYLASGVIKGIGKKTSEKIIEKFGKETLNILEKNPEKLSEIRGISLEKAMEIGELFLEQAELRKSMLFLQNYGISASLAIKIYNHYKKNTINIIKTNPYSLSEEIFGIGFKISDSIAKKIGLEEDSPFRIKVGIKYVLNQAANLQGNVYLPEEKLIEEAYKLLSVNIEMIKTCLKNLQLERQVCIEKTENQNLVFLNSYYYAENVIAKKILELSKNTTSYEKVYDKWLENIENEKNITLAKEQKIAVKEAMVNGVLIITGGPGTGKTTTINSIIKMLKNEGYEIELAAPTGRATKRMTDATGIEAQTIHRLLGLTYMTENKKRQNFEKNEDNPIETDVIIIDECSMIDTILMSNFLNAIANGTRLILVGDVDQLPSVGAGNVLKDIINSNCIKVIRLKEIFRQSRESGIITNAHKINKGQHIDLNENHKDFFFSQKRNIEDINKSIVELITKRLPNYLKVSDLKSIQVLTPMRKSPIGVSALNNVLQQALNPSSIEKLQMEFRNIIFREGDKVMQIKNNYNMPWKIYENHILKEEGLGIFNGDEGIISEINNDKKYVEVIFDEHKKIKYDFSQLDELDLSYAITIHKSQGSEYKAVILPIYSGSSMLLTRNLLYTAVTRAKDLLLILGVPETINKMIDNNNELNRYTYLKNRIKNLYEFIIK